MRTEYVYALVDPRSELPFYIGRSLQPERRVYNHFNGFSSEPVKTWVDEIRAAGMEPTWGVLEKTEDGRTAECQWVQRCVAKGIPLANSFKVNKYTADAEDQAIDLLHSRVGIPVRKGMDGDEGQINISGIPAGYIDQMQVVADSLPGLRRGRLKRAYTEAISALLDTAENSPNEIHLLGSAKGGSRKIIWIPINTAERLDAYLNSKTFKNSFVITAISRYLKSKGE